MKISMQLLPAALLIIETACASSCWANIQKPGLKISGYGGFNSTKITPGSLHMFGETDTLNPNHNNNDQNNATWGVGAAYRFMPPRAPSIMHDISAGLDFLYFETTQHGRTWQFERAAYDNYAYTLPISSSRLMVDSELTFNPLYNYFFPFLQAGIGFARNSASYHDKVLLSNYTGSVNISSNSQYQFAYTLGAGLKMLLPQNFELSVRYLYTDLGQAITSSSANVSLLNPLKIRLTTQTGLVGLTYLF